MESQRIREATFARIARLFKLEEETGYVVWETPTSNRVKVGQRFGALDPRGYRKGQVLGHVVYEHQLKFYILHGYLPEQIDHKDRNKCNIADENLQASNCALNSHNRDAYNQTGVKGVYQYPSGLYYARITFNKQDYSLGTFDNIADAEQAVIQKYKELY